ncbi:MAG: hypothetical protein QQN63_00870 [Nitrosopumilus sp.]
MKKIHIVDGGYLTYLYGVSGWASEHWPPTFIRDALFMMDDKDNVRYDLMPDYKGERKARRAANPDQRRSHDKVESFREIIRGDPRINVVQVSGLEADDLVVLAAWAFRRRKDIKARVLGVDKDLLQGARHLYLYDHNGKRKRISNFQRRLGKTLQSPQIKAAHIPMVLAILGDKSDSIPRLLPPRQLGTLWRLLFDNDGKPDWTAAYRMFGEAFLLNLYTCILPHPSIFGFNPLESFRTLSKGSWSPALLNDISSPSLRKEVRSWI